MMRLLLTGGGTGGHVYPALTTLEWLRRCHRKAIVTLWAGSHRPVERELVTRAGVPHVPLPVAAVRGRSPAGMVQGLLVTASGLAAALRLVDQFRPTVVLATGGYVSAPTVLAARWRRVPVLLYLPDVIPGWAVRALGRWASVVATTTGRARRWLSGARVVVTGYPVRPGFLPWPAASARAQLGLQRDCFTLTVVGGSLGAQRLNEALADRLDDLLRLGQVVHVAGQAGAAALAERRERLSASQRARYYLTAYLEEEMPLALAAADLIVSRAGASVLGEYPALGRGSLLVPGPFSSQLANARYLAARGASLVLPNDRAGEFPTLVHELAGQPARLQAMAAAALRLARPQAVAQLGRLVLELEGQR
ncbi:MAG: UDP-N-acetylglucosamine--N-acetylmuramyl-(pentapeptide) pyrophosphoryl-undecaprenol N-acetylglucosamine transferase [Chloroflexi bacterium]|nr:UDP-N-acetylglucosamine--N-acetylmuramyl-(pentapeptide) pyrophosphoryl-undecaprenol N-acetylglucosamine transferase [Chloroflexota bacterium]